MLQSKRNEIIAWLRDALESPCGLSLQVIDHEARKLLLNAVKTVRDSIPEYRYSLSLINAANNELWIIPKAKLGTPSNAQDEGRASATHPVPEDGGLREAE